MGNKGSAFIDGDIDRAAARELQHFDHTFKGYVHTLEGYISHTFGGKFFNENHKVEITCKSWNIDIKESAGLRASKSITFQYSHITSAEWDHAESAVKIALTKDNNTAYIILGLAASTEFEQELRLRFAGLLDVSNIKLPSNTYVGMFAGATKPKPFQRKRPDLSTLPPGKLPSLQEMRACALRLHRGAYYPCYAGQSRRMKLAIQHVHHGHNTFSVTNFHGPSRLSNQWRQQEAIICLNEEVLWFKPNSQSDTEKYLYSMILDWNIIDDTTPQNDNVAHHHGMQLILNDETQTKMFFSVRFIRDLKHTMEYFWNTYRVRNGLNVKPGSTHGRPLVSITTLSGQRPATEAPIGSSQVVDMDGSYIKPGGKIIRKKTAMDSITGNNVSVYVPPENPDVRGHWNQIVKHQGWLLKKGGVGVGNFKDWIPRYFVLYNTSQGHFLVYYSDFTECPMYTNDKYHRNIVDISKACFIRPGSNRSNDDDIPAYSFDIVTTEREWTVCAETHENMQKWLQLITRAVDEDVAILPDEEIVFKVKSKHDPTGFLNPNDYGTSLKLSAQGVSVTSSFNSEEEKEHFFWVYTDFYKWSLSQQNNKLALLLNVFMDSSFTKKSEFVFRHKESVRLSSAIEYFIEKFMSVMHIRLEIMSNHDTSTPYNSKNYGDINGNRDVTSSIDSSKNSNTSDELDLLGLGSVDGNDIINNNSKNINDDGDLFDAFGISSEPLQQQSVASNSDGINDAFDPFGPATSTTSDDVNKVTNDFTSMNMMSPPPVPNQLAARTLTESIFNADFTSSSSSSSTTTVPSIPAPPTPSVVSLSEEASISTSSTLVTNVINSNDSTFVPPPLLESTITADPFVSNVTSITPSFDTTITALTPTQIVQHETWYSSLLKNTTGPFYDDGFLQILFKLEIRGSQGRLTLSYRNKSSGNLNNFQIKLINDNGMIRFKSNNDAPTVIAPMQPEQQLFFLECMKPATASPILSLSYHDCNSIKHEITIPAPILLIHFNETLSLDPKNFMGKWSILQGQGRDTSFIMSIGGVTLTDLKDVISKILRFGLVAELCQDSVLVAAASLRTGTTSASGEKVSIGCLLRITLESNTNDIHCEVRTLHSSATAALKEVILKVISQLKR